MTSKYKEIPVTLTFHKKGGGLVKMQATKVVLKKPRKWKLTYKKIKRMVDDFKDVEGKCEQLTAEHWGLA